MLIRLAEIIEDEPLEWRDDREVRPEDLAETEILAVEALGWGGVVTKTLSGHLFTASLRYRQTLACNRCLEAVSLPVEAEIVLVVESGRAEPMVGEVELDDDDLDVVFVEGDNLDTDPILMEQLQLNVPMAVVCREDCRGLCPECGTNLNLGSCSCPRSAVDPRWRALEGLKTKN